MVNSVFTRFKLIRLVAGAVAVALVSLVPGGFVAADDIHGVSDEIFSYSDNPDRATFGLREGEYISSITLNQARNVTPPITELFVKVDTNRSKYSSIYYGYIEAISPSGQKVVPDQFKPVTGSYPWGCDGNNTTGYGCNISSEEKLYSNLRCGTYNLCSQRLSFYFLKFPIGSEAGAWSLALTVYWSNNEKVGTVTQAVKYSKSFQFPNSIIVAATAAPTTTTTTTTLVPTIVAPTTTTTRPIAAAIKIGAKCPFVGKRTKVGATKIVCKKVGKKLLWQRG